MKLGKLADRWICAITAAVMGVVLIGCSSEAKKAPPTEKQESKQESPPQASDKADPDKEITAASPKSDTEKPGMPDFRSAPGLTGNSAWGVVPTQSTTDEAEETKNQEKKEPAVESPMPPETQPAAPENQPAAKVDPLSDPNTPGDSPAAEEKPVDLGEPVVDKPQDLKRLDKEKPLWLDPAAKQVVMIGQVCQTNAPLEMFACIKDTKEHEAILSIDVDAVKVHAALMALGADPGNPVRFIPDFCPARGPEVEVTVAWKNKEGKVERARAQDWVRNVNTEKELEYPFVFAGSGFWTNPETKERHYLAQGGDFICVSNFPSAMLDLPVESTQQNANLEYQAFTERIPPKGTPVTVILTPKTAASPAEGDKSAKPAEEKAPSAAEGDKVAPPAEAGKAASATEGEKQQ